MTGMRKDTKKRLIFILAGFTVLFLLLAIRLFFLQILHGKTYEAMAVQQAFKNHIISPKRGLILDKNYAELAVNVPVETIYMNPNIVRDSVKDINKTAEEMAAILNIDKNNLLVKLNKSNLYEVILKKADKILSDNFKNWMETREVEGIYFTKEDKRYYPNKSLAAQLIGFTGIDNQGLAGIELSMEKYLLGQPGIISGYFDAGGQELPVDREKNISAQDGLNVVLTIDSDLQSYTEKILQEAIDVNKVVNGGIAIAMDPRNGQILAMATKPDFNPNSPFEIPLNLNTETNLKLNSVSNTEITAEKLWINKAVSYTYEPGSTFKSITASASLEEGIIAPESEVVDEPIKVAGWTINSMKPGGHGKETFVQSVYNSDNPVFVKLSMELGLDKFYSYVRAFGFKEKTGIELPGEAVGIFQKNPAVIDMATASFGQSFQITPIQMVTAYNAIENGGYLLKPQIIKELTDSKGNIVKLFNTQNIRNVISHKTSDTLKNILEGVVSEGTGKEAYIEGYSIAGKTGTSETFEKGKRSEDKYVASFMGFAPADNPLISVLVILDQPAGDSYYGGKVAAPVAAQIIKYALDNNN